MMTTRSASPRRRILYSAGLLVLVAAGAGIGAYFTWWPEETPLPVIDTEGLDPQVATAIRDARADLDKRPESGPTWGKLGMVLFAHDLYEASMPIFREAERLEPGEPRWPYLLGLASSFQTPEEGITALRRAVEVSPRTTAIRLRLAEQLMKLGRNDEAEPEFREVLAKRPNDPRALLGLGQILSRRGEWGEAVGPLRQAAEHPTAQRSARVALAETLLRMGNPEQADAERQLASKVPADEDWEDPILQQVSRLRTGLLAGIESASNYLADGQFREAHGVIMRVIQKYPNAEDAYLMLGRILMQVGEDEQAEAALLKATQINPDLVEAHFLLAGIKMRGERYPEAEQGYLKVIAMKSDHGWAHQYLGEARLRQGDRTRALEAFRDAVRCRSDLAAMHLRLGEVLLEGGQAEEAVGYLATAVDLEGENEKARELLAEARKAAAGG